MTIEDEVAELEGAIELKRLEGEFLAAKTAHHAGQLTDDEWKTAKTRFHEVRTYIKLMDHTRPLPRAGVAQPASLDMSTGA